MFPGIGQVLAWGRRFPRRLRRPRGTIHKAPGSRDKRPVAGQLPGQGRHRNAPQRGLVRVAVGDEGPLESGVVAGRHDHDRADLPARELLVRGRGRRSGITVAGVRRDQPAQALDRSRLGLGQEGVDLLAQRLLVGRIKQAGHRSRTDPRTCLLRRALRHLRRGTWCGGVGRSRLGRFGLAAPCHANNDHPSPDEPIAVGHDCVPETTADCFATTNSLHRNARQGRASTDKLIPLAESNQTQPIGLLLIGLGRGGYSAIARRVSAGRHPAAPRPGHGFGRC